MESNQGTVREGFRVVKTTFIVPDNIGQLDPQTKRKATICNLFVNHQLTIADVIRVLDDSYRHAIGVLIDQGVIEDRRSVPRPAVDSSSRLGLRSKFKKRTSTGPEPKR
jgi:hypothetical protein